VETLVRVDTGRVVVIVPPNADVDLSCRAGVGDLECLGHHDSGPDTRIDDFVDNGADGPGGLHINLTARVGAGQVEVRRG